MSSATDAPAGVAALAIDGLADVVLAALSTVRDPELDEPITTLGFVASCTVSADGQAQVRLRLPTYFCAPNFAFLMVADAYDAVTAVPGVAGVEVALDDHFASDAINAGVAARASSSTPAETPCRWSIRLPASSIPMASFPNPTGPHWPGW